MAEDIRFAPLAQSRASVPRSGDRGPAVKRPGHRSRRSSLRSSRKASYDKIVPLCASHHRCYDEHRAPFDRPEVREAFKPLARVTEEPWLARLRQTGRARQETE